ncbi:MAG: EpsD family peptidyl-prolyl cis-trans isomerase [Pseudomonadota bacterium]
MISPRSTPRVRTRFWPLAWLAAAAIALAGCGTQDADTAEDRSGQTVARVDGQDITVHQLNYRLRMMLGGQTGVDERAAADAAARQLVERELLVKRAIATKRDREPPVMVAIEETRKDILAAAYLENVAAGAAAPTDKDLLDYYDAHPLKYAQRKVYLVRQILTDDSVTRADVEGFGEQSPTAEMLVTWLQGRGTKVLVTVHTWSMDQLPDALAERLQNLRKGHAIMMAAPGGRGLSINYLVDVNDSPQTFEQAREAIAKTLLDERRKAMQEAEMERLRGEATIAWFGEFKDRQAAAAPDTAQPAAQPAATDAATTEPAEATAEDATPPKANDESLDAGIRGLR